MDNISGYELEDLGVRFPPSLPINKLPPVAQLVVASV
jgi:hypothetical protein